MNAADRRLLIDRCLELAWEERHHVFEDTGSRPLSAVREELSAVHERYVELLRPVDLSRNPLTGEVFRLHLDTLDLDAPWWSRDPVVRPPEDRLPECFAFTGAMQLRGDAPSTPWLITPGPEVPFVVPRLLGPPSVQAVVSQVTVGPHQGFLLAYFVTEPEPDITRINQWGLADYWHRVEGGDAGWDETYEEGEERDFDLAPWIERGRVSWIAPDDPSLTLRTEVADCPYVGLEGSHEPTYIQRGRVWRFSDL